MRIGELLAPPAPNTSRSGFLLRAIRSRSQRFALERRRLAATPRGQAGRLRASRRDASTPFIAAMPGSQSGRSAARQKAPLRAFQNPIIPSGHCPGLTVLKTMSRSIPMTPPSV